MLVLDVCVHGTGDGLAFGEGGVVGLAGWMVRLIVDV